MMRIHKGKTLRNTLLLTLLLIMGWSACSSREGPRFVTARELTSRLDFSELTPIEVKRFEIVVNNEVSPCGDNVTLAEALFNPKHCPLAPLAGRFVINKIMDDYNPEEVSEAYVARYAAVKGLDIPQGGSPRIGAKNPLATLVIFTDFQCPFCAQSAKRIHDLSRAYPEEITVIYKHFPLSTHPLSEHAARAAYAAQQQDKFWQMHDTIFSTIGSPLNRERLEVIAEGLGLDMDQFREDVASPAATATISADQKLGKQLGVTGTPAIFINGRLLKNGIKSLDERLSEEFLRNDHQ